MTYINKMGLMLFILAQTYVIVIDEFLWWKAVIYLGLMLFGTYLFTRDES